MSSLDLDASSPLPHRRRRALVCMANGRHHARPTANGRNGLLDSTPMYFRGPFKRHAKCRTWSHEHVESRKARNQEERREKAPNSPTKIKSESSAKECKRVWRRREGVATEEAPPPPSLVRGTWNHFWSADPRRRAGAEGLDADAGRRERRRAASAPSAGASKASLGRTRRAAVALHLPLRRSLLLTGRRSLASSCAGLVSRSLPFVDILLFCSFWRRCPNRILGFYFENDTLWHLGGISAAGSEASIISANNAKKLTRPQICAHEPKHGTLLARMLMSDMFAGYMLTRSSADERLLSSYSLLATRY